MKKPTTDWQYPMRGIVAKACALFTSCAGESSNALLETNALHGMFPPSPTSHNDMRISYETCMNRFAHAACQPHTRLNSCSRLAGIYVVMKTYEKFIRCRVLRLNAESIFRKKFRVIQWQKNAASPLAVAGGMYDPARTRTWNLRHRKAMP